jgi:predicted DNA binding protein
MRRLIVEVPKKEFSKFENEQGFLKINAQKIKILEVLRFLRNDREEVSFICRVEFKDPSSRIKDLFQNEDLTAQLLDHEKNGAYIYLIKGKPQTEQHVHEVFSGYVYAPFEIRDGRVKMGFLGDEKQVTGFLDALEKTEVHYRIVLLAEAKFSPESPLSRLTEKQRRAIVLAYELGYFESPRKISSEQLAKKLNLVKSTLTVHLRRAERRLLADMLNE